MAFRRRLPARPASRVQAARRLPSGAPRPAPTGPGTGDVEAPRPDGALIQAVAALAAERCQAARVEVFRVEAGELRLLAEHRAGGSAKTSGEPVASGTLAGRAWRERRTARAGGAVATPLPGPGGPVGVLVARRSPARPFSSRDVDRLEMIAAQAALHLQRQAEPAGEDGRLAEALEQQAAIAEILAALSRSPTNLQPVLETVARAAARFCGAPDVVIVRVDGDTLQGAAAVGQIQDAVVDRLGSVAALRFPVTRGSVSGRCVVDRRVVSVPDLAAEPETEFPEGRELQRLLGHRAVVAAPLLQEGLPLGAIVLFRMEPDPFSPRQLRLLSLFADQAAIAIHTVSLTQELAARNAELTESLEQQTASAEILQVISRSPTDLRPVLDSMAESAARLCEADDASIFRLEGDRLVLAACHGSVPGEPWLPVTPDTVNGRAVLELRPISVSDLQAAEVEYPGGSAIARQRGVRTFAAVPLQRNGAALGTISLRRSEVRPFSQRQVALLQTFADQAVIAIENVRLFRELEARNGALTEALEQQTATGEILRVISGSPTDVQPVFEAIARSAVTLCRASVSTVTRLDGEWVHLGAVHGPPPEGIEALRRVFPIRPSGDSGAVRAIRDQAVVMIPDVLTDPHYRIQTAALTAGFRALLAVPMLRDGRAIGAITVGRADVGVFTDEEVRLLRTFADQAVIAVENVRLFTELEAQNRALTESLEQQTATGEILRIIARSPTDVQPVFDIIARNARRLCSAVVVAVFRLEAGQLHFVAHEGFTPEGLESTRRAFPAPADRGSAAGRSVLESQVVQIPDVEADPEYRFGWVARQAAFRSIAAVPLLRDGVAVGVITVRRPQAGLFPEAQVQLLQTFADQAVIAIENVRLFQELEAKNHALTETLEQRTATADILRAISRSPTDTQPVFDIIGERALRLCQADVSIVTRREGAWLQLVSFHGLEGEGAWMLRAAFPMRLDAQTVSARTAQGGSAVHVADVLSDPHYERKDDARVGGWRGALGVPMLRDGHVTGVIFVARSRPGLFADSQVELLRTFADQAVIAVENVRLFRELEARNGALTESLEQQTATAEILRVISRSPTDVQPVFDIIGERAMRLCQADVAIVTQLEEARLRLVALHGLEGEGDRLARQAFPMCLDAETVSARAARTGTVVHVADVLGDLSYEQKNAARVGGLRGSLGVPMLREGQVIGIIFVARRRPGLFADSQVELLQTFADQAVIAIENVRLFTELEARNQALTESLEQQTATGEILRVISSSPTDVQPVFDTIVHSAVHLCGGLIGAAVTYDGREMRPVAMHNYTPAARAAVERMYPMPPGRQQLLGRAILDRDVAHVADVLQDPEYRPEVAQAGGWRGALAVPMLRDGQPIGAILVTRVEAGLFSDRQVSLLKTFADQAVIAVENVRLFTELEARNQALTESLEQQTATGDILRVISSSPTDVQPVFDSIAESAARLCGARFCFVFKLDHGQLHFVAHHGLASGGYQAVRAAWPRPATRDTAAGRSILDGRVAHIPDVQAEPGYGLIREAQVASFRATVAVPMLREGTPVGTINVAREVAGPFSPRQIELLQTFAAQAVIAVENVRLFQELEARTAALTRSVDELQALGEVSRAVSSTLDLEQVLETIVSRAVQLAGSQRGLVYEFDEAAQAFHARATHAISEEHLAAIRADPIRLGEGLVGRAGVIGQPVQVTNLEDERHLVAPQVRDLLAREGLRSVLAVPLIREGRLLGGLVVIRREGGAFSPEVVTAMETLAAQSVMAIQNARLFRETERQRQYSEALVETSPVAIVTMDLEGRVMGWNPGAERLFAYSAAEAQGRRMEELVATPETLEDMRANIRQTLAGQSLRAIAHRTRQDGTRVDVEIASRPVTVDGQQVGMIAIYHDITELVRARREAEAANEAKGAFLATMSHEIRTPLNAVIGMSGLLLNTPLADEQREYAEIVRQSGDALLSVINDILDFSKIEAGKLELESQALDVRDCVEGALDLVAPRAAEKGLDLAYLVGDGVPPAVIGDVTRLRQVLLNLLSNAVKFTERGEVVLTVEAAPAGPAAVPGLTFAVRDTGIGIPPDRLDRLFQSFSQVDASTTRRYGGTGLGLAISRRLVELMGGRIGVTSQPGQGSEFRFTVPAPAAESAVRVRRDLDREQPILRGKRILAVDDNATNRLILDAHLRAWGMTVRSTGLPAEALAWVEGGERFDAGILDMHMPDMDGVALARGIRQAAGPAAPPLILFTSLGRHEARAASSEFTAYLHKPIKPSQLFDTLASVLVESPLPEARPGAARDDLDPGLGGRHPLRILLAEDNAVNQKVALRLLGQMGYRADVAANGLEAIEAVARQPYDVVLMDVQMPELDGLEASREINRRWPARRPRLVAMTANAMQGDRDLCVAAGMDDYVSKPIRVPDLVAALLRCRPGASPIPGPGPTSAPAREAAGGEPAVAAVDPAVFESLASTMGREFVAELVDTFVEDARELLAALRGALAAGDLDGFRRAAHSLKSNAQTLGAGEMAAGARELEELARAGRLEGTGPRVERLVATLPPVTQALLELRRDLSA